MSKFVRACAEVRPDLLFFSTSPAGHPKEKKKESLACAVKPGRAFFPVSQGGKKGEAVMAESNRQRQGCATDY